jgi:hypothetical protein
MYERHDPDLKNVQNIFALHVSLFFVYAENVEGSVCADFADGRLLLEVAEVVAEPG